MQLRVGRKKSFLDYILYHRFKFDTILLDNSQLNLCRVFVFDNVLLNEPSRVRPCAEPSEPCYIAWLIAASHSHLSSLNAASASTVWSFA